MPQVGEDVQGSPPRVPGLIGAAEREVGVAEVGERFGLVEAVTA